MKEFENLEDEEFGFSSFNSAVRYPRGDVTDCPNFRAQWQWPSEEAVLNCMELQTGGKTDFDWKAKALVNHGKLKGGRHFRKKCS